MEVIEDTANEIADAESSPEDWASWITYLLESLQEQAEKDIKSTDYETMLVTLRDDLTIRIDGGRW